MSNLAADAVDSHTRPQVSHRAEGWRSAERSDANETKGRVNVESEQDKQASAAPQSESPKAPAEEQGSASGEPQAAGESPEKSADAVAPSASRRRVFIGLGVGAVVIIGAALAMQRAPGEPMQTGSTVAADITLITSDRADVDCAAAKGIDPYRCGFSDENMPWHGDEANKLKPYYTTDRHLYLIPGLFLQPALEARFKSEPPEKPRDQLKRFNAKCNLKIAGKVGGVRTRWVPTGAWSDPQEVEVATVIDCKVDG
jgi:hypothetical protein